MDLIIYCVILAIIGFSKVGMTANVSDEVGLSGSQTVVETVDMPVGSNLGLLKELGAYTAILRELRLM